MMWILHKLGVFDVHLFFMENSLCQGIFAQGCIVWIFMNLNYLTIMHNHIFDRKYFSDYYILRNARKKISLNIKLLFPSKLIIYIIFIIFDSHRFWNLPFVVHPIWRPIYRKCHLDILSKKAPRTSQPKSWIFMASK